MYLLNCQTSYHHKVEIPGMTAIADFEQRWRQRGKNADSIECELISSSH